MEEEIVPEAAVLKGCIGELLLDALLFGVVVLKKRTYLYLGLAAYKNNIIWIIDVL